MNWLVKDKKFYKLLATLALPVILQNMITIGVNIMDTVMLGSYGEVQLSGSSLANDFINLFQILCMGVGGGAAVLSAQFYGRKDYLNVKKTVALMLRLITAVAVLCMLASAWIPQVIMGIYTPDEAVIEKGVIYLRYSIPTFFLMGITMTLTLILRSIRDVKVPLYTSIGSFFVNIFFNWVFIFGHLGAPEMQIAGAAVGTVIARTFELVMIGGYFFFKEKQICFRLKDMLISTGDLLGTYFKYSVPVICSDFLLGIGNSMVSVIIGHIGTSFVAANSIVAMIQRLCTVMTQGIGQAAQVITGNNVGAGLKEKAYREGVTMLFLSTAMGLLTSVILLIIGPAIIGAYNITEETRAIAMQLLYAISIIVVFQALQSVLTKGILRGGGDTRFCMMVDATFLWLLSIPLGWITGVMLGLPAFIVYICLKIDWIVKVIVCLIRFRSKKWICVVKS
jgi:putative MATE family efflux protein